MFGRAFGALDRHIGKGVLRRNSQPVPVSIDAYAGTGPDGQIWLAVPMVMMSGARSAIPVRRVAASVDSGEGGCKACTVDTAEKVTVKTMHSIVKAASSGVWRRVIPRSYGRRA